MKLHFLGVSYHASSFRTPISGLVLALHTSGLHGKVLSASLSGWLLPPQQLHRWPVRVLPPLGNHLFSHGGAWDLLLASKCKALTLSWGRQSSGCVLSCSSPPCLLHTATTCACARRRCTLWPTDEAAALALALFTLPLASCSPGCARGPAVNNYCVSGAKSAA